MTKKQLAPELNSAFLVFCEEFEKHLQVLEEESNNQVTPSNVQDLETRRRRIENRFHTIRGGAGFFQLDEVYAICTDGEKLFQAATEAEDFTSALTALPGLVDSLKQCAIHNTEE